MAVKRFRNANEAYRARRHWIDRYCKPCKPTPFSPGTREKMAVLRARYWAGQELYHPDDGGDSFMGTPLPTKGEARKLS
jgi:hypothetical protein